MNNYFLKSTVRHFYLTTTHEFKLEQFLLKWYKSSEIKCFGLSSMNTEIERSENDRTK